MFKLKTQKSLAYKCPLIFLHCLKRFCWDGNIILLYLLLVDFDFFQRQMFDFERKNQMLRQDLELLNNLTCCVQACTLCLSVAARAEIFLGIKLTSKSCGETVTPARPLSDGSPAPGFSMSKTCSRELKNNCSSISAILSPRHILCPAPNGMKCLGLWSLPSSVRNLSGLKASGSSQTSGSM